MSPGRGPVVVVAALSVVFAVVQAVYRIAFSLYDPDEFQHVHIAWSWAQGLLPYRDFWEHHGPLYGLWNRTLFSLLGAPTFDWCVLLRAQNGVLLVVLVVLSGHLARRLARGAPLAGVVAVGLLAPTEILIHKGVEIRPDTLQAVLWVGAVCLLLDPTTSWRRFAAGLLLGLAVATNAKALLGIAALAGPLVWLEARRLGARSAARQVVDVAGGMLLPIVVMLIGFARAHALTDFLYYNLPYNSAFAAQQSHAQHNVGKFYLEAIVATPIFIVAAVAGCIRFLRRRTERDSVDAVGISMLICAAVMTAFALWARQFGQYYLSVLPLAVAVCVAGVRDVLADERRGMRIALCAVIGLNVMTAERAARFSFNDHGAEARETTAVILANSARSEPVVTLWNSCGGYMFNRDVQFMWARQPSMFKEPHALHDDAALFGPPFTQKLVDQRVRYIVAGPAEVRRLMPTTQAFIEAEFERASSCLLVRRKVTQAQPDRPAPPP